MPSKLNKTTLKMINDIDLVRVSFQDLSAESKLYTYKAPKGIFKAEHLAVVQVKNAFKFVIVDSIVSEDKKSDYLNVSYDLKWLLCRVTDIAKDIKQQEAELFDS